MKKILFFAFFAVMSLTVSAQNKNDGTYEYFIEVYLEWGGKNHIPNVYFENDVWEIEQIAQKYDGRATLFMGSSYEKKLAQKLNAFFAITSNPCLDKEILNRSHIGTHGCISLVEDLYNHF